MKILSGKETDLTTGPLIPKIIKFALPLMLTGILQLTFNTADLIVVGQFAENGAIGIGAVGGTGPIINLVINIFIGLSVGSSVFVARYIGAKDSKKTFETVHTSILIGIIGGIVCMIVGVIFSGVFLEWIDTQPEFIELSTLYMRIYFLGIPATLVYNFGASILRASGDTSHPMIFLTISGVVNVLLNLLMVLGFNRSVDGVAIASAVSQYIAAGLVVWFLCKKVEGPHKLYLKKLRIYRQRLWEIVRIGVPAGVQGALFSVSNIIIQKAVNSFGIPDLVSGSVASGSIEGFIYTAMNTFHHAALSFVGQNIGAGKANRVGKITGTCVAMVTVVGLVAGAAVCLCGRPLLKLYITGEATDSVIDYGMTRLLIISLTYFTCGIMDTFSGVLRGMGASLIPTVICLTGVCGLRIAYIYTYFQSHHTMSVLFMSYPISWVVTIVAQFVFFLYLRKKIIKKQDIQRDDF